MKPTGREDLPHPVNPFHPVHSHPALFDAGGDGLVQVTSRILAGLRGLVAWLALFGHVTAMNNALASDTPDLSRLE
ncbi:hypothetical protein U2044_15490, partial [Listeria monocytogenes]|uniref:hypothetical protein n=1 Tax=Listeria monocytogenes TaxID=1639 RepID=UPI002FDC65BA